MKQEQGGFVKESPFPPLQKAQCVLFSLRYMVHGTDM